MKSNLSYFLDVFKLRSEVIAEHLFVNKTLISKWKHGARKIAPDYAKRLAEFLYDYDKSGGYDYILPIISRAYPLNDLSERSACIDALRAFLTKDDGFEVWPKSKESDFDGSFQMFFGKKGLLSALKFLFDAVKRGGEYLYCINADNIEWFCDKNFKDLWTSALEGLFERKKVKLRLINRMDWRIKDIKNIADSVLRHEISKKIESVFYLGSRYNGDSFVAVLPNFAVLRVNYDAEAEDGISCSMFFDRYNLSRYLRECERLFHEGKRLVFHNIFDDNSIGIDIKGGSNVFVASSSFPVLPIDIHELKNECGLSDDEVKRVEKYPELFRGASRYILNREGIKDALKFDVFFHDVLSDIFKKDIVLSKRFLIECGRKLIKRVMDGDSKLFVLSGGDYFAKTDIILGEKYAFCSINEKNGFFNDANLLSFMNAYYEEEYSRILCGHKTQEQHLDEFVALLNGQA